MVYIEHNIYQKNSLLKSIENDVVETYNLVGRAVEYGCPQLWFMNEELHLKIWQRRANILDVYNPKG